MKGSLAKRRKLARELEAKHKRQLELIAEMAAAYHAEGKEVPPELATALGAVEHRRRAFQQVKSVLLETTSGIGVDKVVRRFLDSIQEDNAKIMALINRGVQHEVSDAE